MKLSTKTRYGMRLMVDLASKQGTEPVHLNKIARRLALSDKYLEQIISVLKSVGLVISVRGAKGGYYLARDAAKISVLEIVEVLEGKLEIVSCLGDANCGRDDNCVTRRLWSMMTDSLTDLLTKVSLEDLVKWQGEIDGFLNYVI